MRKFARTISGVTPVAVMAKPMGCPGKCIYCPTYSNSPQSYTPESPAVIRARNCDYDPGKQVEIRLRVLSEMGHSANKIELIIMGGTFLAYPREYQHNFIKSCYDALNGKPSTTLDEAKHFNENAAYRCIGLCIETRPDWCNEEQIQQMLAFGTTRVELGVQMLDDKIYEIVKRGHTVADVANATKLLKESGLKVYYHWMPGLPGSSPEHDLELSKLLFEDDRFKPDGLKLYPTLIIQGTELEQWYKDNRYQPYSTDQIVNLMVEIKQLIPGYVRISRVMRDIPGNFISAGCRDLSLRGILKKRLHDLNITCKCIRCREYGHRLADGRKAGTPQLKRIDYEASGGREIFLSYEDEKETLFGLLRLRIGKGHDVSEIVSAIVRELHVFGTEVPIGEQHVSSAQHKGLGGKLLQEAEKISRDEFGASKISIISGVGARDYFRSEFNYKLENAYMVKDL